MSLKYDISDCQKVAANNNGKCLSFCYSGANNKMVWECIHKHCWETSFSHIINNKSWCPYCSGRYKYDIIECQAIANIHGGKCLSKKYLSNSKLLKWQCGIGHKWKASFANILRGTWCLKCANNIKYTIKDCITIAQNRGGRCRSNIYSGAHSDIKWECGKKHIWKASLSNIRNGKWCPYCAKTISKPQKEIYKYIKNIFPQLNIILNNTKTIKPFHIDIYIPKLKIGIEYDGEYWHYSEWAIKNGSLERMKRKDKVCINNNINLIRVREKYWMNNKEIELQKIIDSIEKIINTC